jgi:hypothetical protein
VFLGGGGVAVQCSVKPLYRLQLMEQRGIVPAVETRMLNLRDQINTTRIGLRNSFVSWMRRPKPVLPKQYHYSTMEARIRVLADLAFMLQVWLWRVSDFARLCPCPWVCKHVRLDLA